MTIDNFKHGVQAQMSSYTTGILGLLAVPPKFKEKIKQLDRIAKHNQNLSLLNEALQIVLALLMTARKDGMIVNCPKLQRRKYYPRVAS